MLMPTTAGETCSIARVIALRRELETSSFTRSRSTTGVTGPREPPPPSGWALQAERIKVIERIGRRSRATVLDLIVIDISEVFDLELAASRTAAGTRAPRS